MNQILSHKEKAQRVATQMGDALSTLVSQPQIDYAHETIVQGNAKVHETVKLHQQTTKAFVAALENDIENIRTVVAEFERIDNQLKYDIKSYHFK